MREIWVCYKPRGTSRWGWIYCPRLKKKIRYYMECEGRKNFPPTPCPYLHKIVWHPVEKCYIILCKYQGD